jgi:phage terminase large subunit
MTSTTKVSLKSIVGGGYNEFWRSRHRYRVVKGGRASKKSTTTALWIIYHMMKYPKANTLVLRRHFTDHKDSTFAQLQWAIDRLQVSHLWYAKQNPMEIIYRPTGQKIIFRGLDKPQSITSITVKTGYLCWVWIEEAYQITNEDDFDKVDLSIRGDTGDLWKQITLTFNPWNEKHWLKRRFFDNPSPSTLTMTTTYHCNEFLGPDDLALFEWMKEHSPRRYRVEGLGEWGVAEGAIFENWRVEEFDWREVAKRRKAVACFGLDFGYAVDPTAFIAIIADPEARELYVFDEHYERGMTNDEIARMIERKGYAKEKITADSAEPKSIEEIRRYGIRNIHPAEKGPDSVLHGIQRLQQYTIIVHPRCQYTQIELANYVWARAKDGTMLNKPIDEYDHLMDAMRYATERLEHLVTTKAPSLVGVGTSYWHV